MNIAIIGYGKMGHMVEKLAIEKGITIKSIIDPIADGATHKEINGESLNDVDVCIEFSLPEVAVANAKRIAELGKNHVMATTGWLDKLDEAKRVIEKSETGFVYASNFSIGVNVFYRIARVAAKIINNIEDYDIFGYELHHNRKKDSPSGTAKSIGKILVDNIDRKNKLVFDKLARKIEPDELHFASVRGGDIPGTHVVGFDSTADTIELKHTARSRNGFALGALMAAEWINDKKGFFEINDMMVDVIK
ncbi:4-hydroxy-tetrahydrodipicolinate reductase [Candidatus Woesearchaeota archaeon]|nr:4-hydroxy-tetrahydrodipicolinate reductase [Candidatus Woesearchaeota archaeon]